MQDVEKLFGTTVQELERMLSTKTVVGDPIQLGDHTLVPLISVGFGFGVGAGSGNDPKQGPGSGGGSAGGGGVKPIAIIVAGPDGVRIESVNTGAASVVEKVADTVGRAIERRDNAKATSET